MARMHRGAGEPIDLNQASAEELALLEGVDLQRAEAIVAYRLQHGPFRSWEELDQVPGLEAARIGRMKGRAFLSVSRPHAPPR